MRKVRWVVAALWVLTSACESGETLLVVDVRTDLAPGIEFDEIRTDVVGGATVVHDASLGDDFARGVRVASLSGLGLGVQELTVTLLSGTETIMNRELRVQVVAAQQSATVLLARSCAGVRCGDNTTCDDGICVDVRCSDSSPEFCGPATCTVDADCAPVTAACSAAECRPSGRCFAVPDHSQCAEPLVCDPELGCTSGGGFCALPPACPSGDCPFTFAEAHPLAMIPHGASLRAVRVNDAGTRFRLLTSNDGAPHVSIVGRSCLSGVAEVLQQWTLPFPDADAMAVNEDETSWIFATSRGLIELRGLDATPQALALPTTVREPSLSPDGLELLGVESGEVARYLRPTLDAPFESAGTLELGRPATHPCRLDETHIAYVGDDQAWLYDGATSTALEAVVDASISSLSMAARSGELFFVSERPWSPGGRGVWRQGVCRGDVCVDVPVACEEPGGVLSPDGRSCYFAIESTLTWPASRDACHAQGARLASLHSEAEADTVHDMIRSRIGRFPGPFRVGYIGANDLRDEGRLRWDGGEPFAFAQWADGEPNDSRGDEDCVSIDGFFLSQQGRGASWNDFACDLEIVDGHAVCERSRWLP